MKHSKRFEEHVEAEEKLGNKIDEFYAWVEKEKFDEFATYKDRYEADLENYVESYFPELVDEFLNLKQDE